MTQGREPSFFSEYRWWVIGTVVGGIALIILLVVFTSGTSLAPFGYAIF